jgi:hypothetical protein
MKKVTNKTKAVRSENCGGGTGDPIRRISTNDNAITPGISRKMGINQTFALIRLKS